MIYNTSCTKMSFRTRFISLCNLVFSCLCFAEQLSDEIDDQQSLVSCELPDSVIHEILMKLPVKSVIRCRRICKAWYQLISDSYFSNVYFKSYPLNVTAITQHWKYSESRFWLRDSFFCYVEVGRSDEMITRNGLNLKAIISPVKKRKFNSETLVGSCDGLLCLVETTPMSTDSRSIPCFSDMTVWIVNPLIGEYKTVPKLYCKYLELHVVYGFGSTVDGGHYKVIKVAMNSHKRTSQAHVITIGVDLYWRKVDISSMPLRFYSHGVLLNGVLHWLGDDGDVVKPHGVIYAFDILNEKGRCFKLPSAVGRKTCEIYLGVRNGHLCITDSSDERQVAIWTMKQYGEVESWSRDVIISPKDIIRVLSRVLIPITTMRNGNLLLSCRTFSKLFSCDPKTVNCIEVKDIDTNRSCKLASAYGYTPSFIAPHDIMRDDIFVKIQAWFIN